MKNFQENDNNRVHKIENFFKTVSRFAIVYVIAFAFGALISFSNVYRSFSAIAPLLIAIFDLFNRKKGLPDFSATSKYENSQTKIVSTDENLLDIEYINHKIQTIEAEILEIRKFNKEFNSFRPSLKTALSDISLLKSKSSSLELSAMKADISQLTQVVKRNMERLAQHTRLLNDINDIQCKISILPSTVENIEHMRRTISELSHVNTTIVELLEAEKKNASDIIALTQLINHLSANNANENTGSINPSQIMLIMKAVDMLEGHDFEYFCADLLKKSGYENVSVTKGSGDQGVDVLATKGGVKYAVQCKCYSSELGNTPVQQVHAGKQVYGCQIGIVMTNNYFTAGAKALATATGVLLWDRNILEKMLMDVS